MVKTGQYVNITQAQFIITCINSLLVITGVHWTGGGYSCNCLCLWSRQLQCLEALQQLVLCAQMGVCGRHD